MKYKIIKKCQICEKKLFDFLNLGKQPLCDDLSKKPNNNIKEFTTAAFNSLLQEWMQYTAVSSSDGYSLSYNIGASGSGNTRGSGMVDTILDGSGNYQTRFVNTDDYRAQEFPNGSVTTAATYYLRIHKS